MSQVCCECGRQTPLGLNMLHYDRCELSPRNAKLVNPFNGQPRDWRDVNSDPEGKLMMSPTQPMRAASR